MTETWTIERINDGEKIDDQMYKRFDTKDSIEL